jgi:hypothetical protein
MPEIKKNDQDYFTREEIAKMITDGTIIKGKYELNVGPNNEIKISKIMHYWIYRDN